MELRNSSGIVIKQVNWSDTSKIITLFSLDFGKIQLIARGARGPKSKFRGIVDLLNVISFSYQYKPGRDLNYLADLDLEISMQSVSEVYENYIFSLAIIELLEQLMELDDSHQNLYSQTVDLFQLLKTKQEPRFVFIRFLLILMRELGFELNMQFCANCGSTLEKQYQYHIDYGILCENCLNPNVANYMPVTVFSLLYKIQYADIEKLKLYEFDQRTLKESIEIVLAYAENHLNKQLNLKSLKQLHG